jgi:hypothetical protein
MDAYEAAIGVVSTDGSFQICRSHEKGHRRKPTPLGQYLTLWNAWFQSGLRGMELRGAFLRLATTGAQVSDAAKTKSQQWKSRGKGNRC